MSNQLQIESYRISMRKLRTFYRKVTEFLNDDKIMCLHRLGVIVIIELYRRVKQTVYLYNKIGYLCRNLSGCGMHISSTELSNLRIKTGSSDIWSDVFHVYRPTVFSGSRACSATLFAVSRWKRACSRTENYGKVSKATCIRIDIIRTYRFQSIRKNYIVKFTTIIECIISWLSVLYALNGRKVSIWILIRYEKEKI